MSYTYYANLLEKSMKKPEKEDWFDKDFASDEGYVPFPAKNSSYNLTPQEGLDVVAFMRYVLQSSEYDRAIAKIFEDFPEVNDNLTPIEIPKIYDIPDEVQESYNERGYRLVKRPSGGNS